MHLTPLLALLLTLLPPALTQSLSIETTLPIPPSRCPHRTKSGSTIKVHYRGTLASTGAQFDASYDRGQPLSFQLGAGRVIQGWDQGLLDMCVGEKRTLTVPPELGYGNRAMGPIPAGATLVFETELVGIVGVENEGRAVTEAEGEGEEGRDEL